MTRGKWIGLLIGGAGLLMGYEVLTRKTSPLANGAEAFAREGAEPMTVTVTVYALKPTLMERPGEEMTDEHLAQVTAEHFHQYPIVKAQGVTDAALAQEVVQGVVEGMRRRVSMAKCFDPRHGLRMTRGSKHVDLVICYECRLVEVWGLGEAGEERIRQYDTTSGSSLGVMEKALGSSKL